MSTFKKVFPNRHTLLVVIHAVDFEQIWHNSMIAKQEGADGIFLINHKISHLWLIYYYSMLKERLPDFWIGLNCLDLGPSAINVVPPNTAGLWVDNPGIKEDAENPTARAEEFKIIRQKSNWSGLYFGGVAFKYQTPVVDIARISRLAIPFMDVITTSGAGTGLSPDVSKIRLMREAIGYHPLAIASGITPENVSSYLPFCDCFLVATGISDSHTELNPAKVRQLARIIKGQ